MQRPPVGLSIHASLTNAAQVLFVQHLSKVRVRLPCTPNTRRTQNIPQLQVYPSFTHCTSPVYSQYTLFKVRVCRVYSQYTQNSKYPSDCSTRCRYITTEAKWLAPLSRHMACFLSHACSTYQVHIFTLSRMSNLCSYILLLFQSSIHCPVICIYIILFIVYVQAMSVQILFHAYAQVFST